MTLDSVDFLFFSFLSSASVASNDVPLRIHCTAEKFEDAAEQCFVPMQVFKVRLGLLHLLLVGQPTGFPCWTS